MTTAPLLEALLGEAGDTSESTSNQAVKAVAWARVSTEMQEERGLSLPEQLREIRVYAETRGIEIVEEFSEAASAFQRDEKRVEFRRMLAAARSNPEVNVILVHDFSRFSRDSVRAKSLVRELRQVGIRVVSLNDPEIDPESVAGVYMEAITFAKNEAYSREVAFHTRKGCRANAQTRDTQTGWCYKNGGQPIFGFRSVQLKRGEERRGRAIMKTIWLPDETMVSGRPMHEWAQECLRMAARGASLDELRDFCNSHGIPGRRKQFWSQSTWNSLLQPAVLMKYCGYEVWNVHRKDGSQRPPDEWLIVEDAHPPLITEEEARTIGAARQSAKGKRFDTGYSRSRTSSYLLSGGLFVCERCGSNMVGYYSTSGRYYLCGSQVYRRGLDCGPGVYVRQSEVEAEVVTGLRELLSACSDPAGLVRTLNDELRALWEASVGYNPGAEKQMATVDRKIANIRRAIADGLDDISWANEELRQLSTQRDELEKATVPAGKPPRVDAKAALSYQRDLDKTLAKSGPAAARALVQECIEQMRLLPDALEVEIDYRLPSKAMKGGCGSSRDSAAHRDRRGSGGGIRTRFELREAALSGGALALRADTAGRAGNAADWPRGVRLPLPRRTRRSPGRIRGFESPAGF